MLATRMLPAIIVISLITSLENTTNACPFCAAQSQTFGEEMATMDAVVIARLVESPPAASQSARISEVQRAKFQITKIIKGHEHLQQRQVVEAIYYGEAKVGDSFLIMGLEPPPIDWTTPLKLSERAVGYVTGLAKLPDEGPQRLEFFLNYLEDDDEMVARDCYDEFARAPYDVVKALKMRMDHDKLVEWIQSPDVPASRRRLYLTMLGVCGSNKDLTMLESMMASDDRKDKAGLDALIGCYLTLSGPGGLPLVEDLFLKNQQAEYADTYAAIMALRFHGTEADVIPRERIVEAMRHMLDRPRLADLVIPDLARWQDWSVMDKLVKLFKEADEKSSWVRVPVINYLRACPKPEAEVHLDELAKIDPAAMKRANTFFPFPAATDTGKDAAADSEN